MAQSHDKHKDAHSHPAISRRDLLILGGVALVASALPASFARLEPDHQHLQVALMGLLADPESAARLGTAWRAHAALPNEPGVVAASIGKRLRGFGWQEDATPEELRKALIARISHDYATNDMADVESWQLARTAAELCLLAACVNGAATHGAEPVHG